MFTEFDRLAMTRALALAERGLETTHPNPRVGCVLAKGDRIIGEGWHERAGEPHAEIMALRSAKEPVAGATAYVTLEPCSHHGRTPPCANALIEARIARVVFAVQDPNPRVSGQGADALLRAGITVEAGLMQNEATELNIGFMKRMKEGLPWVRVKLAMSLDGRTALANGTSQWITGEPARADVQRWRARCSAVMTGVGTLLADDPQLNVRLQGFKGRQPLRVVLDARLRSPPGAKMFALSGGDRAAGAGSAGAAKTGGVAEVAGAGVVGGNVVVFVAAADGFAANAGVGRGAALSDPSTLCDDLAELVNAFESSPTAVSARTDTVAGPVSVKAEPRASLSGASAAPPTASATQAPPLAETGAPAQGLPSTSTEVGASPSVATTASSAAVVPSSAASAAAASGPAGGAPSVPAGGVASAPAAATATEGTGVSPPVLAAAGDAAGVAPTSDDATWAGAALSGAVPVRREEEAASNGATPPATPPANAPAPRVAAPGANSTTTSAPATAGAAPQLAGPKVDSPAAFQVRKAALAGKGVRIEEVPADDGFLDLFAVLKKLGEMEVNEVLVEAGPTLAGQLLTTFFVDELLLYVAPKLLGPQGRPLVNLPELQSLQDAWGFSLFDAKRFGDDLRLRMRPK